MLKPLKGKTPFRGFFFAAAAGLLAVSGTVLAKAPADARPRILSFADENWLTLSIGRWDAGRKWTDGTQFYDPPEPRETVSLFGTSGKLGEVLVRNEHRAPPDGTNAGWSARIDSAATPAQPLALAIQGSWPDPGETSKDLGTNDPAVIRMVSDYLKSRGLNVPAPYVTQAFEVNLRNDDRKQILICAHSDDSALRDDQSAVVYALALLRSGRPGKEKTKALAAQAALKPAGTAIDQFERTHGKRDFYRFLAFHDINGDGRKEIVLYRAKDEGTQVDVFTFGRRRARRVLSAYKPGYN